MAYSRWSDSRWYVFGCSDESTPLAEQKLAIHDVNGAIAHYSFSHLTQNLTAILYEIKNDTSANESEIIELKNYIETFVDEVGRQSSGEFQR